MLWQTTWSACSPLIGGSHSGDLEPIVLFIYILCATKDNPASSPPSLVRPREIATPRTTEAQAGQASPPLFRCGVSARTDGWPPALFSESYVRHPSVPVTRA